MAQNFLKQDSLLDSEMGSKSIHIIIIALALISVSLPVFAQTKKSAPKTQPKIQHKSEKELEAELSKSRADLIERANDYKKSLEDLIAVYEPEVKIAQENVARLNALLADGIVSKREIEKEQEKLAAAQLKIEQTRKQMGEVDTLVAEVTAAEQLERMPAPRVGSYMTTATIIRYSGPSRWLIADAAKLEGYFRQQFGRTLPISAFGQSGTHDRMGYDHRNSIDVALHPDSAEGQALMAFLRSQGIPFLAFRGAVPGSATGPHIHVGPPSKRFTP